MEQELKLKQIIAEGQKLAEKKSWLEKGFNDFLTKINAELSKIPDMEEDPISYTIREWTVDEGGHDCKRQIAIRLMFWSDAYIELRYGELHCGSYEWRWEGMLFPTTATIREFAKKLPDAFDAFLKKIEERNSANQIAIDIIKGFLERL